MELHHPARAERVIFLYMDGGPGQMDTFDPKPELARWDGKPLPIEAPATQFDDVGTVLPSPWAFAPGGESACPSRICSQRSGPRRTSSAWCAR